MALPVIIQIITKYKYTNALITLLGQIIDFEKVTMQTPIINIINPHTKSSQ